MRIASLLATLVLFVAPAAAAPKAKAPRTPAPQPPAGDAEVAAAVRAAQAWLALTDAGEYGQAYDQGAALMRGAVRREQFVQAHDGVRKPLGALVRREVKSTTRAKSLPGAPDGDYVVIQFKTSFAAKQDATETVTPTREPDGAWRVSGYYIR